MTVSVLTAPGLYNSGPDHWQSRWEVEFEGVRRVSQKNWHTPDVAEWIAALDAEIERTGDDIVLAAHSLACCMTAKWAAPHPCDFNADYDGSAISARQGLADCP